MPLFSTLRSAALSSLTISEAVRLGSQNIANAENPNYHRHEVDFSTTDLNTVRISRVRRVTAEGLERRYTRQISEAAYRSTLQSYTEEIKITAGLGGVTSSSGELEAPILDLAINRFESSLRDLQASPESSSAFNEFVASGRDLVTQVQETSVSLQRLRYRIDDQINRQTVELNRLTDRLRTLNGQVASAYNTGQQEGVLNQREEVIREIAERISVQVVEDARGRKNLYLQNGKILVYENIARELRFDRGTRELSLDTDTNIIATGDEHNLGNGSITALFDLVRDGDSSISSTDEDIALIAKYETQLEHFSRTLIDSRSSSATLDEIATSGGLNDTYHNFRIAQLRREGETDANLLLLARRDLFSVRDGTALAPVMNVRNEIEFSSYLIDGTPDTYTIRGTPDRTVNINIIDSLETTEESQNILSAFNAVTRQIPPALAANSIVTERVTAGTLAAAAQLPTALQQENQSYYGLVQGISVKLSDVAVAYEDRSVQQNGAKDDLQVLLSNFVGVNIDEEFLKINQLQQTYAANARVINSVQQMLDDLLRSV